MEKLARPKVIGGITVRMATGCGNMYIQLNWYKGHLFEIFATLGHSGGCSMSYSEALTRSITTGLRQQVPVPIDDYVDQLHDIRCLNPHSFPKEEATLSCPDAIAKALVEYGSLSVEDVMKLILKSNELDEITPSEEEKQAMENLARLKEEREKLGV